jgi:hypothetical protein
VDRVERESAGGRADALEAFDLRNLRALEGELRGGDERVAGELRSGLSELREREPAAAVLLPEPLALLVREVREAARIGVGEVDRPGDGHVGADPG